MPDQLITPDNDPRAIKVIEALNRQNENLRPEDREAKYKKMQESAFVFYRGSNHLFWDDFAGDSRIGRFGGFRTRTWLQGDLHVENFGAFGNDEGIVVYDINDFDEAVIADYQYDLWRMAVSILLVARENAGLSTGDEQEILEDFSEAYLDAVADYCENGGEHETIFDKTNTFGRVDNLIEKVEKKNSREDMLAEWTDGEKFLPNQENEKLAEIDPALDDEIRAAMEQYKNETLVKMPEGADDNYFDVLDIARRLSAGTGSLGTPRFYVLIRGIEDEEAEEHGKRILDVKLQTRPIAYQFLPRENLLEYEFFIERMAGHDAVWHAAAYRAMATDTDDHLGWLELSDGFYSVREISFFKDSIDLEDMDSKNRLSNLAKQWGMIIATDHSRALTDFNDDFSGIDLNSILFRPESGRKAFKCRVTERTEGKVDEFSDLVKEVAFAYAEQVAADWTVFTEALESSND